MRLLLAVALAAALASCAPYTLVSPGPTTAADGNLSVRPGIAWNRANAASSTGIFEEGSKIEVWTLNGMDLDQLVFYGGIAPGQAVYKGRGAAEMPRFRKGMTANEVVELWETSLARGLQARNLVVRDIRPAKLGELDGFRFQIGFALPDDVDRELTAIGAVKGDRLYVISWWGTRLYHHPKNLPEFERIAASARVTGG